VVEFRSGVRVDPEILQRMGAAMVHRGPDDRGIYCEGRAGLALQRLSIIDLTTGHQPISNEDGTLWIVFNGEIYNHAALREQLESHGHRYTTRSDTETIVHLYEEYGKDCVQHLRGMFAFALWDTRKERFFAARDRFGIKPFYYCLTPERFLFGSEIKTLLAHPAVRPEFQQTVLPEYLAFGYLSGPETFYAGIRKLMPGHTLEVDASGQVAIEQYWELSTANDHVSHPAPYYVERYRELLEGAVSSHLMSDVPLGVFLSGGIDSSAVAALATKHRAAPVDTFSVGYEEATHSELPFARVAAQHLNSHHHEVVLSCQDFFDALPMLTWHEDEPIVWPSSVSLYFVARLAKQYVKVVLTGEGADETLAGYTRYAFTVKNAALDQYYRRMAPGFLRHALRELILTSHSFGANLRRKLSHTFLARDGASWEDFYFDNFFSAFTASDQATLLSDELCQELNSGAAYGNVRNYWEHSAGDLLQRLLYTDLKTYLVELLMKQDNMSMAASVESRVPFLDHELVEFALTIPRSVQIRGLAGKQVLKEAMANLLPRSVLHRRKLGFPTPWREWLSGPQLNFVEKMLLDGRSMERGLFRRSNVEQLFREHRHGYRDHSDRIWRLLTLELWHRVCLEGEAHDIRGAEPRGS